ncbi:MAG TPA: nuclear transport factor 2 family protein [Polyangiaceae bacterium]|nr:nuclear transport factor 2 family protein [Polyangiaceae bacterium]
MARFVSRMMFLASAGVGLACEGGAVARGPAPPPAPSAAATAPPAPAPSAAAAPAQSAAAERVARDAFERFRQGWRTGNFDSYLARLRRDDFEFSFPVGELRGRARGPEGYARMVRKLNADAQGGVRLELSEPLHVSTDGRTTVFEFESSGRIGEIDYRARNAIALEVEGDQVVGFREYFGDVDPRMFAPPPARGAAPAASGRPGAVDARRPRTAP